ILVIDAFAYFSAVHSEYGERAVETVDDPIFLDTDRHVLITFRFVIAFAVTLPGRDKLGEDCRGLPASRQPPKSSPDGAVSPAPVFEGSDRFFVPSGVQSASQLMSIPVQ